MKGSSAHVPILNGFSPFRKEKMLHAITGMEHFGCIFLGVVLNPAAGQVMCARKISTSVTVIAPPILVAICAKGIRTMRLAAVSIATSPVPP